MSVRKLFRDEAYFDVFLDLHPCSILQVIATDKGKPSFQSTATVTINIKDTNDNSPTFPEVTYKLNVTEHSPVGTEVAVITVRL